MQRHAGRHLEPPHRPRVLARRGRSAAGGLDVGRPAARPGDQDVERQAQDVGAREHRHDVERDPGDEAGEDQQSAGLARVPAGRHGERHDDHQGAEREPPDVDLQVHGGGEEETEREQPDHRDRQMQPDRERHPRHQALEERDVHAGPVAREQPHQQRDRDRAGEEPQCRGLGDEAPVGRGVGGVEPALVGERHRPRHARGRVRPASRRPARRRAPAACPRSARSTARRTAGGRAPRAGRRG